MSWSPVRPDLRFGTQILTNLHTYLKANADAAVTWANGNVALTPYARIETNTRISKEHPSLAVVEARNQPTWDDSSYATAISQEFLIETIVSGTAPGKLLEELRIRVVANWQLIISITEAELMAGMAGSFTQPVVELNSAVFSGVRKPETSGGLYEQTALQSFTVSYTQVNS